MDVWNKQMRTEYHSNGAIKSIMYRQGNMVHRDNGPAIQAWNNAGALIMEWWCQNGHLHRNNGPAIQKWNSAGILIQEIWGQNGRKLTAAEIEKIMRPADIMAAIWTLPQPIAEEIAAVFRAV